MSWMTDYFWLVLMLPAAAGIALDLFLTRNGAGISGDGVWYVDGAQNILKGFGYGVMRADGFIPINEFPPFYSIVLSGLGIFGGSIFEIARTLNAVLLGGNIFLVGWLIFRLTRSLGIALLGGIFILFSWDTLLIHTWVMTEPLFIFLTLLCLVTILLFIEKNLYRYLVFAGLAVGFSIITRYVGVALVAASCLCVLLLFPNKWGRRFQGAAIVGLFGILPTAAWFLRNAILKLSLAGRSGVVLRLPPRETIAAFFNTIWSWVFPSTFDLHKEFRFVMLTVALIVLIGIPCYYLIFRPHHATPNQHSKYASFLFAVMIFLVIYIATVALSIVLALAGNPFSWYRTQVPRYLIPAFTMFFLLISLCLYQWFQISNKKNLLRLIPVILTIGLFGTHVFQFTQAFKTHVPLGYTDTRNSRPELMAALNAIDPNRPIVTNDYERIYFLTGRPVYSIPGDTDELTGQVNPEHEQLMQNIYHLIDQGAVVVIVRVQPSDHFFFDPLLSTLKLLGNYDEITLYSKLSSK